MSYKLGAYSYYLRPGYKEFLNALYSHPRITVGFYSSIMAKNIVPIIEKFKESDWGYLLFD